VVQVCFLIPTSAGLLLTSMDLGSVSDSVFSNFIGHSNAYSLDINAYWESAQAPGNGVLYTGLTFSNWKGTCANGAQRAPIQLLCSSTTPCTGLNINNFAIWTDTGSYEYYKCQNAWGDGPCLVHGSAHTPCKFQYMIPEDGRANE
jgi:rhamnogalacturonan hydrolase